MVELSCLPVEVTIRPYSLGDCQGIAYYTGYL